MSFILPVLAQVGALAVIWTSFRTREKEGGPRGDDSLGDKIYLWVKSWIPEAWEDKNGVRDRERIWDGGGAESDSGTDRREGKPLRSGIDQSSHNILTETGSQPQYIPHASHILRRRGQFSDSGEGEGYGNTSLPRIRSNSSSYDLGYFSPLGSNIEFCPAHGPLELTLRERLPSSEPRRQMRHRYSDSHPRNREESERISERTTGRGNDRSPFNFSPLKADKPGRKPRKETNTLHRDESKRDGALRGGDSGLGSEISTEEEEEEEEESPTDTSHRSRARKPTTSREKRGKTASNEERVPKPEKEERDNRDSESHGPPARTRWTKPKQRPSDPTGSQTAHNESPRRAKLTNGAKAAVGPQVKPMPRKVVPSGTSSEAETEGTQQPSLQARPAENTKKEGQQKEPDSKTPSKTTQPPMATSGPRIQPPPRKLAPPGEPSRTDLEVTEGQSQKVRRGEGKDAIAGKLSVSTEISKGATVAGAAEIEQAGLEPESDAPPPPARVHPGMPKPQALTSDAGKQSPGTAGAKTIMQSNVPESALLSARNASPTLGRISSLSRPSSTHSGSQQERRQRQVAKSSSRESDSDSSPPRNFPKPSRERALSSAEDNSTDDSQPPPKRGVPRAANPPKPGQDGKEEKVSSTSVLHTGLTPSGSAAVSSAGANKVPQIPLDATTTGAKIASGAGLEPSPWALQTLNTGRESPRSSPAGTQRPQPFSKESDSLRSPRRNAARPRNRAPSPLRQGRRSSVGDVTDPVTAPASHGQLATLPAASSVAPNSTGRDQGVSNSLRRKILEPQGRLGIEALQQYLDKGRSPIASTPLQPGLRKGVMDLDSDAISDGPESSGNDALGQMARNSSTGSVTKIPPKQISRKRKGDLGIQPRNESKRQMGRNDRKMLRSAGPEAVTGDLPRSATRKTIKTSDTSDESMDEDPRLMRRSAEAKVNTNSAVLNTAPPGAGPSSPLTPGKNGLLATNDVGRSRHPSPPGEQNNAQKSVNGSTRMSSSEESSDGDISPILGPHPGAQSGKGPFNHGRVTPGESQGSTPRYLPTIVTPSGPPKLNAQSAALVNSSDTSDDQYSMEEPKAPFDASTASADWPLTAEATAVLNGRHDPDMRNGPPEEKATVPPQPRARRAISPPTRQSKGPGQAFYGGHNARGKVSGSEVNGPMSQPRSGPRTKVPKVTATSLPASSAVQKMSELSIAWTDCKEAASTMRRNYKSSAATLVVAGLYICGAWWLGLYSSPQSTASSSIVARSVHRFVHASPVYPRSSGTDSTLASDLGSFSRGRFVGLCLVYHVCVQGFGLYLSAKAFAPKEESVADKEAQPIRRKKRSGNPGRRRVPRAAEVPQPEVGLEKRISEELTAYLMYTWHLPGKIWDDYDWLDWVRWVHVVAIACCIGLIARQFMQASQLAMGAVPSSTALDLRLTAQAWQAGLNAMGDDMHFYLLILQASVYLAWTGPLVFAIARVSEPSANAR